MTFAPVSRGNGHVALLAHAGCFQHSMFTEQTRTSLLCTCIALLMVCRLAAQKKSLHAPLSTKVYFINAGPQFFPYTPGTNSAFCRSPNALESVPVVMQFPFCEMTCHFLSYVVNCCWYCLYIKALTPVHSVNGSG